MPGYALRDIQVGGAVLTVYASGTACSGCEAASGEQLHLHIRALPAEVRKVRRKVRQTLTWWGCSSETVDDMVLLASELAGNAVVHGGDGLITVNLLRLGNRLLLEVTDASPVAPTVRQAGSEDEQGRGMYLVEEIASAWGVRREPGGGKAIWCTLTC